MKINRVFSTIDTHTGGEPTRTIIGGLPYIPGKTIVEKMHYLKENMDWIRTSLMFEPRGHSVMSGVILTEPTHPEADIGVIFIETGGYLPMCGHDTIGVSTALVETGMITVEEPFTYITLDTPAGLTRVKVHVENGKARSVTFRNIPSFVFAKDVEVYVPGFGKIKMDVSYGGNVYAILPADAVELEILPENASEIIQKGRMVRDAVNSQVRIQHPEKPFVNECTHVQFYGKPSAPDADLKNTVFFADSGIDRSPCGTGTSAKVATLYAKGELKLNEEFVHESIIGSIFVARAVEEAKVGPYEAIVPEVTGSAYVTGMSQFVIDPDDPHRNGFLLS
ncbi:MAG: proline racemase family protein [Deltaproteobacteria bacterium]|nr:proline racemase family protein [Deltaproteobacteria bacterium]MBW1929833.1 proline racemase family protein [Deltaproteobacteria bacterium]MBW2024122.1 proline racemase family protein [Deltaproteobacteria bacterium]MBW2124381.1 proline racemase family protein [Deltaproteobacteria bacterium]RLB24412.1 MAG: proline racemase [Deltaproteobacteria bacterium]